MNASVTAFVACSAVLFVKYQLVIMIQGTKAFDSGGRPPEDSKLAMAKIKQTYGFDTDVKDERKLKAREVEHRWRRIVANDLEQIPITLLVFAGGILANSNSTVHTAALVVFTATRCFHTYAYANAMQPHRARCFLLGLAASVVGAVNTFVAVL